MDTKETKARCDPACRVKRKVYSRQSEPVIVCWHCGASGHEKNACLPFHLDRAMAQLLPKAANPRIREMVRDSARKTLEIALLNGHRGVQLCFGGSPWQLHMDWPMHSPPPPFPTPGVWHLGVYYGDDWFHIRIESQSTQWKLYTKVERSLFVFLFSGEFFNSPTPFPRKQQFKVLFLQSLEDSRLVRASIANQIIFYPIVC